MTRNDFNKLLNIYPKVTAQGFGRHWASNMTFDQLRVELENSLFEACEAEYWLSQFPRTKNINKRIGSGKIIGLRMSKWSSDNLNRQVKISSGAVPIAAHHLGFMCEKMRGFPDYNLNISNRKKIEGHWINPRVLRG